MTWNAVHRAATPLLSIEYERALTQGEIAELLWRLTEQALALTGAGVLLGLGIGTIFSAAGVYLFKQRQFQQKLQS